MLRDFLEEILKPLLRKWIDAIVLWVQELPVLAQANIVLAVAIIGLTWAFHDALSQWTSLDERLVRVMFLGKDKPPIASDLREVLNREIGNRTEQLRAQIEEFFTQPEKKGGYSLNAWTVADIVVAIRDQPVDANQAIAFFDHARGPGSTEFGPASQSVWSKHRGSGFAPHMEVTSWVLLALAQLHRSAGQDELDFVLGSQKRAGWWPVYPSSDRADWNASSDATATAIWALQAQLDAGAKNDSGKISIAIKNGAQWLYSQRVGNTARWKDYPTGRVMLSVSGLVLHALHVARRYDLVEIDRLWLRNLPSTLPRADDFDISAVTVFGESDKPIQSDDIKYYPLPYAITATIDAYPNGNLFERAFALYWLERVLATTPTRVLRGDEYDDWVVALNLIAFEQL